MIQYLWLTQPTMGGQLDDENPVVVAYNLVHYESLHPVHQGDLEEIIKLTNAYIAKPSKYEDLYGFTRNDMEHLTSSSICKTVKEIHQEELPHKIPEKK